MNTDSFMSDFWENYQKFMQDTFSSTQKMMDNIQKSNLHTNNMNVTPDTINQNWVNGLNNNKPKVDVEDSKVIVTLKVNSFPDDESIKVYLEGNQLVVEGVTHARVSLPVAVQKYGARAVYRDGELRIIILRDKFNSRRQIPIELG